MGALADIVIVALMIREAFRPIATRRYWPWLVAMALVTIAMSAPIMLAMRLSNDAATSGAGQALTSPLPVPPSSHRSQDDDADSNLSSLSAFIAPRGRYHSGKGNFRAFLIGMGIGALIFAVLFAVSYL